MKLAVNLSRVNYECEVYNIDLNKMMQLYIKTSDTMKYRILFKLYEIFRLDLLVESLQCNSWIDKFTSVKAIEGVIISSLMS